MWKDESQLAMKALMDGDSAQATTRWQRAIAMAEEACEVPSAELGEVYFNLGKMLADAGQDSQAIVSLKKSVAMLTAVAPAHQRLDTARYQLAALLKKAGDDDASKQLFQQALKIDASPVTYISLTNAIALLKKCDLAFDLTGKVLQALYKELAVKGSDDNEEISELLEVYYSDTKYGEERRETDRFFCEHFTDFDALHVVKTLGELCGMPGLLTLVGTKHTTQGGRSNMLVTLKRDDGKELFLSVASVYGLVGCFNEQFEQRKMDMRFYDLVSEDSCCCYFLTSSTFKFLRDNYALQFDCENSAPANMAGAANPNHGAPAAQVQNKAQDHSQITAPNKSQATAPNKPANAVENKKLGEQILAIQEVLERIPLEELPAILKQLRRLRIEWEGTSDYEYSQEEIDAFERLIVEFVSVVGAARINDRDSEVELPLEVMRFGGQPYAESEVRWPDCPHCGLSLNYVGQISEQIPFDDGSEHYLLVTIFYCFSHWPENSMEGQGFVLLGYWDASPKKFRKIEPKKKLSRPVTPGSRDCVWLDPVEFLPTPTDVDLEELGMPEKYYTQRFHDFINAIKETAHVIGGGPHPPGSHRFTCGECDEELEIGYTLFIEGSTFSIASCPVHPGTSKFAFHQR